MNAEFRFYTCLANIAVGNPPEAIEPIAPSWRAIQDRVFDPFFTTKPVGKGTGQGLALARTAIVDRHARSISFETRQGQGTTFFVRLPIHGRAAAAPRHASAT